jgi:hypothetical protein
MLGQVGLRSKKQHVGCLKVFSSADRLKDLGGSGGGGGVGLG